MKVSRFFIVTAFLWLTANCLGFAGEASSTNADQALALLKEGHQRFVAQKSAHPNQSPQRREQAAAEGQKPFAAILSCSDSRVPPEIIFDQGIGDLFVTRVAGNVADSVDIGTFEYGVEHLHIPLLVVLGHSKCGAVSTAVSHEKVSGKLEELIRQIAPVVAELEATHPTLVGDEKINAAIEANVRYTIDTLVTQSPALRKFVDEKKLTVVGAIYDISTGVVTWLE